MPCYTRENILWYFFNSSFDLLGNLLRGITAFSCIGAKWRLDKYHIHRAEVKIPPSFDQYDLLDFLLILVFLSEFSSASYHEKIMHRFGGQFQVLSGL